MSNNNLIAIIISGYFIFMGIVAFGMMKKESRQAEAQKECVRHHAPKECGILD